MVRFIANKYIPRNSFAAIHTLLHVPLLNCSVYSSWQIVYPYSLLQSTTILYFCWGISSCVFFE